MAIPAYVERSGEINQGNQNLSFANQQGMRSNGKIG